MGMHVPDRSREKTFLPHVGLDWEPDIEDVIDGLSSTFVEQQQSGNGTSNELRGSGHGQQPLFNRSSGERLDRHDYKPPPGAFQRHQQL